MMADPEKARPFHGKIILSLQAIGALSLLLIPYAPDGFWIWTGLVYFLISCVGGTITYHRLLSHGSFVAPSWFEKFGVLCGIWGAYGSPISWAAIHRTHHRYADRKGDPHSRRFLSWWRVQWTSMLVRPNLREAHDLLSSPFLVFVHRNYLYFPFIIIALLAVIDPWAILYAYVWPAVLVWNLASLVNTIGHSIGYRNYEVADDSKNIWWLALVTFGEGWHNNHHARPSRFFFRTKWWEFDLSEWIIRLVRKKNLRPAKS